MSITGINQLWAADITYIRLVREFVYLAVIIDVFSRKCIGWKLGRDIDAKLALAALNMALADRKEMGISNLIHHSDQGVQYASWGSTSAAASWGHVNPFYEFSTSSIAWQRPRNRSKQ